MTKKICLSKYDITSLKPSISLLGPQYLHQAPCFPLEALIKENWTPTLNKTYAIIFTDKFDRTSNVCCDYNNYEQRGRSRSIGNLN